MNFRINNITWTVIFVSPLSNALIDRTGKRTLATTSPIERCVYISNDIQGELLTRVVRHELGHVVLVSYGLLNELGRLVRDGRIIETEEFLCNFVADYGKEIDQVSNYILGSH